MWLRFATIATTDCEVDEVRGSHRQFALCGNLGSVLLFAGTGFSGLKVD